MSSGCLIVDSDDERDFEDDYGKVYFNVAYCQKDVAKQAGMKWCPENKSWYIMSDEQAKYEKVRRLGFDINHEKTTCKIQFKSFTIVYPKSDKPFGFVDYSKFVVGKGHGGRGDNCD